MNTILIVDDTYLNRIMMLEILKRNIENVRFLQAKNGQEALEILYEKEIDLLILDLNMPIKDGYEVLKELKLDKCFSNLPVIVNSSITNTDKIKKALELGAIDFFIKTKKSEDMEIIISSKVSNVLNYYKYINKIVSMNKSLENDMRIATIIQRDFLKTKKEFEDIDMYVHYEPYKSLSGDLFSTAQYKEKEWILLLDMKNSGISSAILSLFFRELFMKYAKFSNSPCELMELLNKKFMTLMDDVKYVFFSAMIVLIENNKIYVANAGQPVEPYIFYKDKIETIKSNGRMIGIMQDSTYSQLSYKFAKGDCLVLFTDGIFSKFDSLNKKETQLAIEKLHKEYIDSIDMDVKKLTFSIYNEFLDKKNGLKDDLTIACLKKIK